MEMNAKAGTLSSGLIGVAVISALMFSFMGCGKSDGTHKEYYASGQLKAEKSFKNGKLEGLAKEYFADGQLRAEKSFKDGKKEGL